MGVPEAEIVVSGTVREAGEGRAVLELEADQAGTPIIRRGEAEVASPR